MALVAIVLNQGTLKGQDGQVVDKIIAKVDDYIILKSELEAAYINFLSTPQASTYDGDARCLILTNYRITL